MRSISILLVFICFIKAYSQVPVQGVVRDKETGKTLSFCSIAVKGSRTCAITNEKGQFLIKAIPGKDTLCFSFIGYNAGAVPAGSLLKNPDVRLQKKSVDLKEVTIHSSNDYLFKALSTLRKSLQHSYVKNHAKVYFGLETEADKEPVELLECYYNGDFLGNNMESLKFKNGRVALDELDQRYFLSLNSSKAIASMKLTESNEYYPSNPLQFNEKEMKKRYSLEPEYIDEHTLKIIFRPLKDTNSSFRGEIWIDPVTNFLQQVNLSVSNTENHPFLPFYYKDSLINVGIDLHQTYKQENKSTVPEVIDFSYHMIYKSVREAPTASVSSIISRDIVSHGLLYFYDFSDPFILPYFEYDNAYYDYFKLCIIPYNERFWENNNPLVLTDNQKEDLGFLARKGNLINYRNPDTGYPFLRLPNADSAKFFEYNYSFWYADKRVLLNRKLKQNTEYSQEAINGSIPADLIRLKVQILLDVNKMNDSLLCRSYTVFDAEKTFYHLPEQNYTSAFLNIYFDICEIERRGMQKKLESFSPTLEQIDEIYAKTKDKMDKITTLYLKEVQMGKNEKALSEWNSYIIENLGIDNLKLFPASAPK
ncbi:MAG: carboxypeptidase-like regulatory domain-containing protein [Bacteroidetes bacterium]|nr:carboxypeptidase-like regulatory domain-containing protein [Bacteroidota bacterium]